MTDPPPPGSFAARSMQAHSAHGSAHGMNANASSAWGHHAQQPQHQYSYGQQQAAMATNTGAAAASALAAHQQQQQQQQQQQYHYQHQYASGATNASAVAATGTSSGQGQQPAAAAGGGGAAAGAAPGGAGTYRTPASHYHHGRDALTPAQAAEQSRLLTDSTRRVQEHAYYMKQGIEGDDLPMVLDRAASMLSELGDPNHHHHHHHHQSADDHHRSHAKATLNPKNYYELHMRCLDELPNLESYLVELSAPPAVDPVAGSPGMASAGSLHHQSPTAAEPRYTAADLYGAVQYTPRAVPRLYLQILAGSVLIKSGEADARTVLEDLIGAVKCVQCPIRGLFLRHYLLGCTRDKLPSGPATLEEVRDVVEGRTADAAKQKEKGEEEDGKGEAEGAPPQGETKGNNKVLFPDVPTSQLEAPGTVADSVAFLLKNFTEMNKLWVRIQHMPSAAGVVSPPAPNNRQAQKEMRKRRERERNELRLLVGTNLVRLSQLDDRCVTAEIYGEIILPAILEQLTACRDPLAQAYIMDCIIQVFPDEFHLATLETFLGVCSKLREKVNIRTIVGSMMDRLGNYFDDAKLVRGEEEAASADDDGVEKKVPGPKTTLTEVDAFHMFDRSIQKVYTARGSTMPPKEVVRLQTALLKFSLKVYPGEMGQISECLGVCARYLSGQDVGEQKGGSDAGGDGVKFDATVSSPRTLDDVAVEELEKLLSIPLDSLALRVLELEHYSNLLTFLPWDNRRQVAAVMLNAVLTSGTTLSDLGQIEEMFSIVAPLIQDKSTDSGSNGGADGGFSRTADLMGALGVGSDPGSDIFDGSCADPNSSGFIEEQVLLGKLVHLLYCDDTDTAYEMLAVARRHLKEGGKKRVAYTLTPVVYSAFKLLETIKDAEFMAEKATDGPPPVSEVESGSVQSDSVSELEDDASTPQEKAGEAIFKKNVNCRKLFLFLQETVAMIAPSDSELGFKLYLQIACIADRCASAAYGSAKAEEGPEHSAIAYEIMAQAFLLYEDDISDSKAQQRSIQSMVGTLLSCKTFEKDDCEALVTKTAQYAAKLLKKADQCKTVMLCAHLFYTGDKDNAKAFRNPQRVLECLQRALKIADACCMASSAHVQLFVDILDQYVYFYENECPVITDKFVSGLVALITEHMENIGAATTDSVAVAEARGHFEQTIRYIKMKKNDEETAEQFAPIQV